MNYKDVFTDRSCMTLAVHQPGMSLRRCATTRFWMTCLFASWLIVLLSGWSHPVFSQQLERLGAQQVVRLKPLPQSDSRHQTVEPGTDVDPSNSFLPLPDLDGELSQPANEKKLNRSSAGPLFKPISPLLAGQLQKSTAIDFFSSSSRSKRDRKVDGRLIRPPSPQIAEILSRPKPNSNQQSLTSLVHKDWQNIQRLNPVNSQNGIDYRHAPRGDTHGDFQVAITSVQLLGTRSAYTLSLEEAMQLAVQNSPELLALNADVIINRQEIIRQDADFDFSHFVETLYDQQSNPVGSNLDGAQGTLRNKVWNLETGFRKRTRTGGQFSLLQRFGHLNSNSSFINPNNQATGNFGVEITQPLARGSTRIVNESGIELARISVNSSQASLRFGIKSQLLKVITAYWDLVQQRGSLAQLNESVQRANTTLVIMEQRQQVDVLPQQLVRARAAVARRQAEAAEARFQAQRLQQVLLRLIFGENYRFQETFEVLPTTISPGTLAIDSFESGLEFALQNRPEVQIAMQDIYSAAVEKRIALNDLNPQLDLIFSVFGKGLRGRSSFRGAFTDQFATGEPSFQLGLNYELPFRNRAARANLTQKEFAIAKLQSELSTVVNDVALDVKEQDILRSQYDQTVAIRKAAMDLARQELRTIETRRQLLLDGNQIASLYLDDLLQAQERLQQAEQAFLRTLTGYGVSQANWLKAIGALDQYNLSIRTAR